MNLVIHEVTDERKLGEEIVFQGLFGVEIPDSLVSYIDYEAIGRDTVINDGQIISSLGVYVEIH
ncbi:MAG: antirestriction protein ArdA [Halanaerobiales bacterium]|nr:antirestriction protein ArdA [Halanaerobiales bacterium]